MSEDRMTAETTRQSLSLHPNIIGFVLEKRPVWVWDNQEHIIVWHNLAAAKLMGGGPGDAFGDATNGSFAQEITKALPSVPLHMIRLKTRAAPGPFPVSISPVALTEGQALSIVTGMQPVDKSSDQNKMTLFAEHLTREGVQFIMLDADGEMAGHFLHAGVNVDDLYAAYLSQSDGPDREKTLLTTNGTTVTGSMMSFGTEGEVPAVLLLDTTDLDIAPDESDPFDDDATFVKQVSAHRLTHATPDGVATTLAAAATTLTGGPDDVSAHAAPDVPKKINFLLDSEGRISELCTELRKLLGSSATFLIGSPFEMLFPPQDAQEVRDLLSRRQTWDGLKRTIGLSDGRVAEVSFAGLPVFGSPTDFAGYRGFGQIETVTTPPNTPHEQRGDGQEPAIDSNTGSDNGVTDTPVALATVSGAALALTSATDQSDEGDDVIHGDADTDFDTDLDADRAESPDTNNVVRLPSLAWRTDHSTLDEQEAAAFRRIARTIESAVEATGDDATAHLEVPGYEHHADQDGQALALAQPINLADDHETGAARTRASSDFSMVFDRLPLGMAIIKDEKIKLANRAFFDVFGYADLDHLHQMGGLSAIFPSASLHEDHEPNPADGLGRRPLKAVCSDGQQTEINARLQSIPWDGETMLLLTIRDEQTAPVKSASTPPPSLRAFSSVVDAIGDGFVTLDSEGTVDNMTPLAENLIGRNIHAFSGLKFWDYLESEDKAKVATAFQETVDQQVPNNSPATVELNVPGSDGSDRPLRMFFQRLSSFEAGDTDNGEIIAVVRDLSTDRAFEQALLTAKKRAEDANVKKSDFVAKISHEMRTPLNAIIGFSEVMMEERFGAVGNARYEDYVKDIHRGGKHLLSLINDILDLSKIEAGKMDLSFTSVNLNDIVQQCVSIMQPEANKERIIIRTSLPSNVPQIVVDAKSLRQIALNILSNSVKYTRPGGQVIVSTRHDPAGDVILTISDTGVGMSESDVITALEPFRQVGDPAQSRPGTGLGLPLTKALVEANRAKFHIDSSVNSGTTIRVTFPVTRVLAE